MEIADFLARIKSEDPSRIIPFIGSGLVRSLGYPSWSSLLDDAAEFAARHSRDVASLMRNRLSRRDLLGAGDLLYEPEIPATELHNFFRSQFDKTPKIPEFLSDFFACAFPAYVTTNFDLTIEQAIAFGGRTPEPFRSTDRFKPFNSRLSVYSSDRSKVSKGALVLKLHGDVADPRFIVLGKRQLENMMEDESLGFLYKSLFWDYTILFLGFSGNDVNFIWQVETIRKVCGIPKAMSYFIHPNGEALPFSSSEVNMEEVTYSPLGDHAELQKALGSMSTVFSKPSQQIAFEFPASPSDEIRQTLAFVTAGLMEKAYEPSFECAAVSMVADAASRVGGLDNKDRLIDEISKTQNVGFDDAARILDSVDSESVVSAIESLADSQKKFNEMIEILREGIDKRSLAYGKPFVKTGSKSNMILYDLLLGVFSRAGKALAMSLLDSDPPDDSLIDRLIRKAIENLNNVGMGDLDKEVLLSVFADMFTRPTPKEGRAIVFLAQATVAHALASTFSGSLKKIKELMPERVYLDANVVIPMVIPDHPLSQQYRTLVRQLSRIDCNAYVLDQFLDEIMHHCKLANEEIKEANLTDISKAHDYTDYHGLTTVNAFVSAYACGGKEDESFEEYIRRWFGTANPKIDEFRAALSKIGIRHEVTSSMDVSASSSLAKHIMEEKKKLSRAAVEVLTEHEAVQVYWIHTQHSEKHVWFITQDAALRRILRRLDRLSFSEYPPSKGIMPAYGASLLLSSVSDRPDLGGSFSALLWNPTYLERVDTMLSSILRGFSDRAQELGRMDLVQLRGEGAKIIQMESHRSEREAIHERAIEYREGKPKLTKSILRQIGEIKK